MEYHDHLTKLADQRRKELEAARRAYNPNDVESARRLKEAEAHHADVQGHLQDHGDGPLASSSSLFVLY